MASESPFVAAASTTASPDSPRTAAAKLSLNPNPANRPRMGEPSLFWGGGRADLNVAQTPQQRALSRRESGRYLESDILPAYNKEIERRTSGNLQSAATAASSNNPPPPKRMPPPRPPPKLPPSDTEDNDDFGVDI